MLVRAALGFAAGVASVLTFHQAAWAALHGVGLMSMAPYPMAPTSFGVPLLFSISVARGVLAALYGLVFRRIDRPAWLSGLALGAVVGSGEWLIAYAQTAQWSIPRWMVLFLMQALVINTAWGIGVGVIFGAMYRMSTPLTRKPLNER